RQVGEDIDRIGRVRNRKLEENAVSFTIMRKDAGSPFAGEAADRCKGAIRERFGQDIKVHVDTDSEMISLDDFQMSEYTRSSVPPGVRNFVAVASGKGGVGESEVGGNLFVLSAEVRCYV